MPSRRELSTDRKGAVAESAIVLAAVRLGLDVYRPVVEGARHDLVLGVGGRLERVQCKWAPLVKGQIVVRCFSARRSPDGLVKRGYTSDEIDAFAAYSPDLDRCFYVPISWVDGRVAVSLRVEPTKNGQRRRVNWADDFAFERLAFEA